MYDADNTATCNISGILYIIIRASQFIGIAPVSFTRRKGIWFIKVTPILCFISYVTTTIINACAITGLMFDLNGQDKAVRTRSPTRKAVWITDFFIVMLTASLAGYRAPIRLRKIVMCLSRIQKLSMLPPKQNKWTRKTNMAFISYLLFVFCLLAVDYCDFVIEVQINNRELTAIGLYVCYYYAYVMLILLDMQYIFSALEISRSMMYVNNILEELSHLLKLQFAHFEDMKTNNRRKIFPMPSLNTAIDSIATRSLEEGFIIYSTSRSLEASISCLADKYSIICDMVRHMDQCYGAEILSLMLSFLLHLVITPYNLIVNLYADKAIDVPVVIMQLLWCILHFSCTVAIVEPSHRIQREIERTTMIVSYMIIKNTDELVSIELKKFSRYLLLNKVSYSPLGICTLSRSVVASILGSVATYLVIIIQFQQQEH